MASTDFFYLCRLSTAGDFGAAPAPAAAPAFPPQAPSAGGFDFGAAPAPAPFEAAPPPPAVAAAPPPPPAAPEDDDAFDFSAPPPELAAIPFGASPAVAAFSPSAMLSTPVSAPPPEAEEGMFGSTIQKEAPGPPKPSQLADQPPMRQPMFDFADPSPAEAPPAAVGFSAPQPPAPAAGPSPFAFNAPAAPAAPSGFDFGAPAAAAPSPFAFDAPAAPAPAPAPPAAAAGGGGFDDDDDFGTFSSATAAAAPAPATPAPASFGAFGAAPSVATGAFGSPAAAAFGAPAMGAFGAPATPFGAPAAFGAPAPSPFAPAAAPSAFPFQPTEASSSFGDFSAAPAAPAAFPAAAAFTPAPAPGGAAAAADDYGFGFDDPAPAVAATPFGGFASAAAAGPAATPDMSLGFAEPRTPEATLAGPPQAPAAVASMFAKPSGALDLVRRRPCFFDKLTHVCSAPPVWFYFPSLARLLVRPPFSSSADISPLRLSGPVWGGRVGSRPAGAHSALVPARRRRRRLRQARRRVAARGAAPDVRRDVEQARQGCLRGDGEGAGGVDHRGRQRCAQRLTPSRSHPPLAQAGRNTRSHVISVIRPLLRHLSILTLRHRVRPPHRPHRGVLPKPQGPGVPRGPRARVLDLCAAQAVRGALRGAKNQLGGVAAFPPELCVGTCERRFPLTNSSTLSLTHPPPALERRRRVRRRAPGGYGRLRGLRRLLGCRGVRPRDGTHPGAWGVGAEAASFF